MAFPLNVTGKYALRDPKHCDKTVLPTSTLQSISACWIHFPNSCAANDHVCLLTLQGHKGTSLPNQDQSVALQLGPTSQLLALFDGHGESGHVVSRAARQLLPLHVLQHRSELSARSDARSFQKAWKDAFLQVDARPAIQRVSHAGTTAIVAFQAGRQLVLASVGDSTVLVVGANGTILAESVHHKPDLPEERRRIESLGGRVYIPDPHLVATHMESSRVLLPGPLGPDTYALAMSRSLGDVEGKEPGYLLAEPDVQVLDLSDEALKAGFVVVGSDGLLDAIPAPQLARTIHQAIRAHALSQACRQLLKQAAEHWDRTTQHSYRDDITLLVAKFLV